MYINPLIEKIYRVKDHEDRRDYIRLDMNENPVGLPQEIVDEILQKITPETIASYPCKERLLQLIAERENVQMENVTLTNGSDEGIKLMYEVFSHQGANAVMVSPTFEMYRVYAQMFGVEVKAIPYGEDFVVTAQQIMDAIDENTDIVVLLNPNSPIGGVYTDEECCQIIEKAGKCNALVCIDEAYYPFGVNSKVKLTKQYDNVMILRTFSKLYSMAGIRIGYAIASPSIIHYLENAEGSYNVNGIGILFAEEILKTPGIMEKLLDTEAEGKRYLIQRLEEYQYEYYGQYGNYVLIKTRKDAKEIAEVLRREKILIKTYGSELLRKWVRITTADKATMQVFWEAYKKAEQL